MIPNKEHNKNEEYFEQIKIKSTLPSRSELHRKKKKKGKVKIKFPLIKLLVLFFILLPIGFYCVYVYLQNQPVYNQQPTASASEWSISLKMASSKMEPFNGRLC